MFENWEELKENCLNCRKCSLCEVRSNVVFGVGNPRAKVMFIGEGPGRNEDLPVSYTHLTLPTNSLV